MSMVVEVPPYEHPGNWKRVTVWDIHGNVIEYSACDVIAQSETGVLEIWAVINNEELVGAAYGPGQWRRFAIKVKA